MWPTHPIVDDSFREVTDELDLVAHIASSRKAGIANTTASLEVLCLLLLATRLAMEALGATMPTMLLTFPIVDGT